MYPTFQMSHASLLSHLTPPLTSYSSNVSLSMMRNWGRNFRTTCSLPYKDSFMSMFISEGWSVESLFSLGNSVSCWRYSSATVVTRTTPWRALIATLGFALPVAPFKEGKLQYSFDSIKAPFALGKEVHPLTHEIFLVDSQLSLV